MICFNGTDQKGIHSKITSKGLLSEQNAGLIEMFFHGSEDFIAFNEWSFTSRNEDDIETGFNFAKEEPIRIFDNSSCTVANDSVTDFFAGGNAEARGVLPIFANISHQNGRNKSRTF